MPVIADNDFMGFRVHSLLFIKSAILTLFVLVEARMILNEKVMISNDLFHFFELF